jgi:hypothetical protein
VTSIPGSTIRADRRLADVEQDIEEVKRRLDLVERELANQIAYREGYLRDRLRSGAIRMTRLEKAFKEATG